MLIINKVNARGMNNKTGRMFDLRSETNVNVRTTVLIDDFFEIFNI